VTLLQDRDRLETKVVELESKLAEIAAALRCDPADDVVRWARGLRADCDSQRERIHELRAKIDEISVRVAVSLTAINSVVDELKARG
jgi:hypothetical protein